MSAPVSDSWRPKEAQETAKAWVDAGLSREGLEAAARSGLANDAFEETSKDTATTEEEFQADAGLGEGLAVGQGSCARMQVDEDGVILNLPSAKGGGLESLRQDLCGAPMQ